MLMTSDPERLANDLVKQRLFVQLPTLDAEAAGAAPGARPSWICSPGAPSDRGSTADGVAALGFDGRCTTGTLRELVSCPRMSAAGRAGLEPLPLSSAGQLTGMAFHCSQVIAQS